MHLLACIAHIEENKRCRSTAEVGKHKMVTPAVLKSKLYENDGKKLNGRPEKSLVENSWCRQGILKKQMTEGQTVGSASRNDLLISHYQSRGQ